MMHSLLGGLPNHLFRRWQRQMERLHCKPIPGVGVAVVPWDEPEHGLVQADRLLLVTLDSLQENGQTILRLGGYRGQRFPFGFRFGEGGPVFTADLQTLPGSLPAAGLDRRSSQAALLAGLKLQDRLLRRRSQPPRGFRMPPLWAGFREGFAITGDGPELSGRAHEAGLTPQELLEQSARRHDRLTFYPLDWTGHHDEHVQAVCADLSRFPRYQANPRATPGDLHGYRGACEFDLRPAQPESSQEPRQSA